MDASLIAATVLFGPGAAALPAIAVLWHRSNRERAAERAAFTQHHTVQAAPVPPPNPGRPLNPPAPTTHAAPVTPAPHRPTTDGPGAVVIDLAARRRAA
ncbi:hypothetical protein [Streptomyces sp. ICBB 8177]|uniref:hypothetical protein n=1 Tax=Streptomyces sp. ICBB 8177 TaxID=563922 RepID=UPI000D682976|nr:hypothetical protein [Streptomyces sp. ICBB 8177]PWI44693.1 hypothetical protein CK485_08190 [Streptomyces sp. ICBB 8177]